jgi:murein DD-endopeptidase MepM/ murein hydrolase activator NlpD
VGASARVRHLSTASLLIASLIVCAFGPRSSEATVVPLKADLQPSDQVIGPGSSPDPLRCVERVAIPAIEQAIDAHWSPDNRHLAFTTIVTSASRKTITGYEEDPALAILDVETGRIVTHGEGKQPQWSASGRYLSFWRQGRLFVLKDGRNIETIEASQPETRWVGEQLVYWSGDEIRGWTEAADVAISVVDRQYVPVFPRDWAEFSGDGQLFTLTRYHMDGSAYRYVGQTLTGQLAPLQTAGTTYTQWAPIGQTLLVRSNDGLELRGPNGWHAAAPLSAFPGPVHGWTPDGKALLMGAVSATVPAGVTFDQFSVWDGRAVLSAATLPNLLGSRAFSPDGRYFVGVARTGLYETVLEIYRCGTRAPVDPSRADPVARARQQRIDADERHFVRPVAGYIAQFLQGAHTGIDVAAPFGSLITAAREGQVTYVGWVPVGGRAVCVLHDAGIESCYYHLSLSLVRKGQWVGRGQPVAAIGMTGLTTGPHVHWEAKQSGRFVDPLKH